MKRFEYSPLGKELKAQTNIAKKQYQKLDNNFEFDKIIKKEKPTFKNYNKSNLIYNSKYSFYKYYHDSKKFDNLSFKSNYSFLYEFLNGLNKLNKLKTKEISKKKKANVYDTALELYNWIARTYLYEYYYLSDAERKKWITNINQNINLKGYDYTAWSKNEEESTDKEELTNKEESVDLSEMPPLEGDEEEVKEGKGLKILTLNKLLTRFSILLAQMKAGNNSNKSKNEIRQILYLLYQDNKINKQVYINLIRSL